MGFFMSTKIGGILAFALVFLSLVVSAELDADVKCENIYKDFSDCVLELGESMDNYQENVTSERGVSAVCRHWEAFHTCALTALSDCQVEVSSIWEKLRQDSMKMRFQGSLFDLCSPSSSPGISSPLAALALPLIVVLIMTGPDWYPV
ncbi:neuritin-like [Sebastes umbrosus]|uniref:neuritin-like n=1 Tax=Sebastes umbrosus TaxID=72105 RepID=UPI00189DB07B|nr:neuritin-like [Sebastes umbrosus]